MHLNPSLALQLVGDRFQIDHQKVNYNFMLDLGDIPLEKQVRLKSDSYSTSAQCGKLLWMTLVPTLLLRTGTASRKACGIPPSDRAAV